MKSKLESLYSSYSQINIAKNVESIYSTQVVST